MYKVFKALLLEREKKQQHANYLFLSRVACTSDKIIKYNVSNKSTISSSKSVLFFVSNVYARNSIFKNILTAE